ncbi:MAG: branched-chain amino acid transport system ATP-binding protein [Methylobacteriaceae bacterium]|nr:branched-chain amino acid transport system ATP-binding protein [Methylobacteriaceae bacterium]
MTRLLEVEAVHAAYGPSEVLFGVSLQIGEGEVVTLLGRNGMGKTTSVRTIMGLMRCSAGRILWRGESIASRPSHVIARRGLGYVPEGRRIFPNLSVRENLLVAGRERDSASAWNLERVLHLFPRLGERLDNGGAELSGGEQQMLAIGRALMTNPSLLVLDEATEGLAPIVREEIWRRLHELKHTGLSMLIIDKELDELCALADRHYVIEKGEIVWSGDTAALQADATVQAMYLAV